MSKKAKKIVEPTVQPARIFIEYDTFKHGGERLSDEEWSCRSDEETTVNFIRLHREAPSNKFFYDSIEVSQPDMLKLDKLYLAVVRYSTGDTFGHSRGNWYIVGVAPTYQIANLMLDEATKPAKQGDYKSYKPWEGYFESLEDVEIHTLELV